MSEELEDYSLRMHNAILPVAQRYVLESGRPDQVYAASFDPTLPLHDYTESHFPAKPLPSFMAVKAGFVIVEKIVKIPQDIMHDVLVPAFREKADELIEWRRERPLVQLTDHTPNLLSQAAQFAGNVAVAERMRGGTRGTRMQCLIRQAHGIGTVGYRPLGIKLTPKGPKKPIGDVARYFNHNHYSIPATQQYRALVMSREDRRRYIHEVFAPKLVRAMQLPVAPVVYKGTGRSDIHPENLRPECVMSPTATKEIVKQGKVFLPAANKGTGLLVDVLEAGILPVYTSFDIDEQGMVVDGKCVVGSIRPHVEGKGFSMVEDYLKELAVFRSKSGYESNPVFYEGHAA